MYDNNIQDRITIDFESVSTEIDSILNDVRMLRGERFFAGALGKGAIEYTKEQEMAIKKHIGDKFNLVIVGDFKRGKSTLINAILGSNILPTAVTPETVTINRLSFSETPKAEAVLKNGRRLALEYSEIKRDMIERLIPQLPASIDYVDIKANNDLLKEISIVDTPGVGDLMNAFDDKVVEYLVNADALIYVVSARAPFSASEQAFLSSMVLPQSFSRIMVVVNMADILESEENVNKVKSLTIERASVIGDNVCIYMLSALDELCRKNKKERPEPELKRFLESSFVEFENALNRDIVMQKDIVKSMRVVSLTDNMLKNIEARINMTQDYLNESTDKLNSNLENFRNHDSQLQKRIEQHKMAVSNDIDEMKQEAFAWMRDFMLRLKDELQRIKDTASMSDIERHFQFYMMDTIKSAVAQLISHHQRYIADKVSAAAKEMAQEITQSTYGGFNEKIAECITDISWTNADTAVFAFEMISANLFGGSLAGYLGPLYLIGQAVMGFVRQKTIEKRQADFISPIIQEYSSITAEVIKNLSKAYDQMKFKAVDMLGEVYQKQTEASVSAIQQAKELVEDETAKKEDIVAYLDSVLISLDGYRKSLQRYQ